MKRAILLYMPVIHKGYLDFLEKYADRTADFFLIDQKTLAGLGQEAEYLSRKDWAIRGLPEEVVRDFVCRQRLYKQVVRLGTQSDSNYTEIVGPDEDITFIAAQYFFPGVPLRTDSSVRLRYDRKGVARVDPVPSVEVVVEEGQRLLMGKAIEMAGRSNDWWLSVGAVIVKDGKILFSAYNKTMPEGITGALGDPRSLYSRGESTDDTLAHHAERSLVAQAARAGVCLEGGDAYVTHFPCVPCACDLIEAGIRRVFFREGYSRLESAALFEAKKVKVIRVMV